MEWIITVSTLVVINILIWVFLWGRTLGKLNNRMANVEDNQNTPLILPECQELFRNMQEGIGHLTGKVDVILGFVKENQKNQERKLTSRKRKRSD